MFEPLSFSVEKFSSTRLQPREFLPDWEKVTSASLSHWDGPIKPYLKPLSGIECTTVMVRGVSGVSKDSTWLPRIIETWLFQRFRENKIVAVGVAHQKCMLTASQFWHHTSVFGASAEQLLLHASSGERFFYFFIYCWGLSHKTRD